MCPHVERGREVIGKLITQGHDKVCPERMDVQELLVVMTATIRHMPLVTQLHKNTSVITTEIRKFRTVVHTFIDQMRDNLETALETLLKGTRRVPEFELSILEDVKLPRRRPQTSKLARPTRSEIHRRIDRFSGIEQEDNARALDSLFLESPVHSHVALAPPIRMVWLAALGSLKSSDVNRASSESKITAGEGTLTRHSFMRDVLNGKLKMNETQRIHPMASGKKLSFDQAPHSSARASRSRSMANIFKHSNQKTDSLLKTLFDSTVPPEVMCTLSFP
jgi:hypothetical protein